MHVPTAGLFTRLHIVANVEPWTRTINTGTITSGIVLLRTYFATHERKMERANVFLKRNMVGSVPTPPTFFKSTKTNLFF
jgi:hypothetical protein